MNSANVVGSGMFNPYKILRHWDRMKRAVEDPRNPPVSVDMSLTNKCNHQCWFCSAEEQHKARPGVMSLVQLAMGCK